MVFTRCIWSTSTEIGGGLAGKMNAVVVAAKRRKCEVMSSLSLEDSTRKE